MSDTAAELPRSLRLLLGTIIAKRYVVDGFLGMGGMAIVFSGRHATLDRSVAIKFLRPEYSANDEVSARFDREARAASNFEHPNCIQVFDCGETDLGLKFMVMPLLEGVELSRVIRDPLPASQAAAIGMQLLHGLEHAHGHGVVHRDLKPDNIFVTTDHENREVLKIVDFGIAKILDSARHRDDLTTKVGAVVGTPAYMSPEQAMGGGAIDARTDLYALGIILYQLVSGRLPFIAADPRGLLFQHVTMDPPALADSVPDPLRDFIMLLLAKEPDRRPSSAAAALELLDAICGQLRADPTPWTRLLARKPSPPPSDPSLARSEPGDKAIPGVPQVHATPGPVTGQTQLYGPNDAPTPPPSSATARPAAGSKEMAQMNDALQRLLNTETDLGLDALRSGIFEAPEGGWNLENLEPLPGASAGKAPTQSDAASENAESDEIDELDEIDQIADIEELEPDDVSDDLEDLSSGPTGN